MKKYFPAIAVVFLFAATYLAQTPTPKPNPSPSDNSDVVKISTNLIQVDVTVLDAKGKIISDLKPEEIEIYENGQKQKISNFLFISAARSLTLKPVPVDKTALPVPPGTLRPEQIKRTIALVVDDLTLSFESAYQTRRALKKFVDEQMQDGDLVAIIRTGAGIGALQQFTSDKRILYAAIERVKWNPIGNGGISAFAPLEAKLPPPTGEPTPTPEQGDRTPEGIEREFNDFRENYFANGTLGAVDFVVRGMSQLPGRKSIILFSDGFSMTNVDAEGFSQASTILDALKRLIDAANRASVVVYAVDPRGLVYTGMTAADDTGGRTAEEIGTAMSDRNAKLTDTQDGLRYLSRETGGFAIVNNNDISGGVRKVLDDQSYYLVAYEPDAETFDPAKRRFNKLVVKVTRPGSQVRYRSGFFNVADKRPVNRAPATLTPGQQIEAALTSPFAVNGINLRLNALFGNDIKNGSYVRSLLHVNTQDLKFTDAPDGSKKAVFDVLAVSFGDNGQPVDQIGKSYTLTVKRERMARLLAEGFVYHFTFPVKKPGAYQFRVAIRDETTQRVGSASQFIEVPNLKKKHTTVSSLVLESLTEEQWKKLVDPNGGPVGTNPMSDTAIRRFKAGSVMRYGYEIYNAKLDASKKPSIQSKTRIFRDGKLILDGQQQPLNLTNQTEMEHLRASGAIALGKQMPPGDYVLQIIITDNMARVKERIATQFVQFEVVE